MRGTLDRPLLVNAAAGTGKTHALAHRIAYVVGELGVQPDDIAVLTFSRATLFVCIK